MRSKLKHVNITTANHTILITNCYKTELGLSCEDNLVTLTQNILIKALSRPEVPSPWPILVPHETCNRNSESTRSAPLAVQPVPTTSKVVLVLILTRRIKMAA